MRESRALARRGTARRRRASREVEVEVELEVEVEVEVEEGRGGGRCHVRSLVFSPLEQREAGKGRDSERE